MDHIKESHPELTKQLFRVNETLLQPDYIIRSKSDPEATLYYKFYENTTVGKKFLCVVVKASQDDYFILTTYFSDTIKRGDLLWTNQKK